MIYIKKKIKILIAYFLIISIVCSNFVSYTFADSDKKTRRTVVFEYWAEVKDYETRKSTNVQSKYATTHPITRLSEFTSNGIMYPGSYSGSLYHSHKEKIYADEVATFLYTDDQMKFSSINKNFNKTYDDQNYTIDYLIVNGQKIKPTQEEPDPIITLSEEGSDTIELHYVEAKTEIINDVEFFDYNISSPNPNGGKVLYGQVAMNTLSLTNGDTDRIVIGHPNVVKPGFTGIGAYYGANVQPEIAKTSLENGQIKLNVADPGLFTTGDLTVNGKIIKKYIDDYKLGFSQTGNTYTLSSVYSGDGTKVLSELEKIRTSYKKGSTTLYSNLFWPLDQYPDYAGKDPLFGQDKDSNYEGLATNDEEGLLGTYVKHNWIFGMHYEVKFTIGDYIGPMDYYFRGDDDFWLYIDGELVQEVDIGGVHSAIGAYVDLKNWMEKKGMLDDLNEEHTMSVYYIERGGSGSCCYMSFTIPTNNDIKNGNTNYTVKKIWDDNNNENRPKEISVVLINAESKEILDSAIITNENEVSQGAWQYEFKDVPIYDINGDEISYQVIEEKTFDNYATEYNVISNTESEIINTYVEPISINVKKVWENDDISDRPESITIILKSDGLEIARADLMAEPNVENTEDVEYGPWSVTFKNLDSLNLDGKEIEYNIEELRNRNYISLVENDDNYNYLITNTLRETPDKEYKELIVKKDWQDNDDFYGTRPESIRIQLREIDSGKVLWEGDMTEQYKEVQVSKTKNSTSSESSLNTATLPDTIKTATPSNATPSTASKTVTKATLSNTQKSVVITEEDFVFEDDGSFDIEDVTENDEDETTQKETSIVSEKARVSKKEDSTVEESDYLDPTDESTEEKYNLETSNDIVKKENGLEEQTLEESTGEEKLLDINEESKIGEESGGLEDSPKEDQESATTDEDDHNDGHDIDNQSDRESAESAESVESADESTIESADEKTDTKEEQNEDTDIILEEEDAKIGEDIEKIAEEEIKETEKTEEVEKNVEEAVQQAIEETEELLADGEFEEIEESIDEDEWTLKFTRVPMYDDDDREIEYEIVEVDVPEGYSAEYYNIDNKEFTIVNKRTVNIAGEKIWVDGEKSAKRPDFITLALFSNDDLVTTINVSENEEWKYEFNDLPMFSDDGTEISYVVREFPVEGYKTSYDGYNIYNTYQGYDVILPECGGEGAVIYYMLGMVLILALGYDLDKKKKNSGCEDSSDIED